MDQFHWAGVVVGLTVIIAAVALAWRDKLGVLHVIVIAIGAVLAGVPVISMTFGTAPSVQIGQFAKAASDANGASQTQSQAIAALNDRVTQLASLVSKIPVAAASPDGSAPKPVAPPVAGTQPSASAAPVFISPKVLGDWNNEVAQFRQSETRVDALNQRSRDLTTSSSEALTQAMGKQ